MGQSILAFICFDFDRLGLDIRLRTASWAVATADREVEIGSGIDETGLVETRAQGLWEGLRLIEPVRALLAAETGRLFLCRLCDEEWVLLKLLLDALVCRLLRDAFGTVTAHASELHPVNGCLEQLVLALCIESLLL